MALFNDFPNSFPILKDMKEENQFDINKKELVEELVANRIFLEENFESN